MNQQWLREVARHKQAGTLPELRTQAYARTRKRRERLKADGLCIDCAERKRSRESMRCLLCSVAISEKRRAA